MVEASQQCLSVEQDKNALLAADLQQLQETYLALHHTHETDIKLSGDEMKDLIAALDRQLLLIVPKQHHTSSTTAGTDGKQDHLVVVAVDSSTQTSAPPIATQMPLPSLPPLPIKRKRVVPDDE